MCRSIAKYLLFAFNFVFWLAGAACLGVGIWLNVDESVANSIEIAGSDVFYAGAYILIAAGAIMLVVGFFGCCGAIKESKCMLGTYFVFLFILFGLQVGIGIACFVEYDTVDEAIMATLQSWELESEDNVLVALQPNFKCCGTVRGCADWYNSTGGMQPSYGCGCDPTTVTTNCNNTAVAAGTCLSDTLYNNEEGTDFLYEEPCDQAIAQFVSDNLLIVAAVALGIGLAEILGMIIAMTLCCSIKKK